MALPPVVEGQQGSAGGEERVRVRQGGGEAGAPQGIKRAACSVTPVTSLNPQEMKDLIKLTPELSSGSDGQWLCGLT